MESTNREIFFSISNRGTQRDTQLTNWLRLPPTLRHTKRENSRAYWVTSIFHHHCHRRRRICLCKFIFPLQKEIFLLLLPNLSRFICMWWGLLGWAEWNEMKKEKLTWLLLVVVNWFLLYCAGAHRQWKLFSRANYWYIFVELFYMHAINYVWFAW